MLYGNGDALKCEVCGYQQMWEEVRKNGGYCVYHPATQSPHDPFIHPDKRHGYIPGSVWYHKSVNFIRWEHQQYRKESQ